MVALEAPRFSALTRLQAEMGATEVMMLLMPAMMAREAPAALDIETELQVKMARVHPRMAVMEVTGTMDTAPEVMAETMTVVMGYMVLRVHPARQARY
jgi:hypothetical protein